MPRRILRHAEQGAIFRESLVSELAQGFDPSQGGIDLPSMFDMLKEHFSDVGEGLTDANDAIEGGHDFSEARGEGLDQAHYVLPSSPAGMAVLSAGELGKHWANSASQFMQRHHQQTGQPPQPHHLMQHAQGWAAANVLPYVNPEMHKYIDPVNALPPAHPSVAPPRRQGPPRDRLDEALNGPPQDMSWMDSVVGPQKKKHRFFGAAPTNRYLLLPHWDPEACFHLMHDHTEDMARHRQATRRTAGYSVKLKLQDGTSEDGPATHLYPDARKGADALAAKHKLYLKEMSRSPDDAGRTPMYLPAYAEGDKYVGTVTIDNADGDFNPYGPHQDQYAYSSKRYALPMATPELMNQAKGGGFTLHDHVGDGPTSGFMVSRNKNTEHSMPMNQLTPQLINNYVHQHTRELASPENYLGGWLDGKNFYLDISSHRPSIDRAASDAVGADQLGIYDLGKGETIYTPDAVEQSGDIGLAYKPRPKDPLTAAVIAAVERSQPGPLPDHDYLQHHLGDAEHWMETPLTHTAATPGQGFDDVPKGVQYAYDHPKSNHGAKVYKDPQGNSWLIKHPPNKASNFLVDGDLATAHIQHLSGLETPATFKTDVGHGPASAQYMYDATDAFPDDEVDPDAIAPEDKMVVQKHHALDWLMGNHDSHSRQFVRTKDTGKVVGIDKTQSFKHFAQDILHWNFHPNSMYNEKEPIYNTLYRHMARGGTPLFDPRDGELGKYVQGLQEIPDQEYADTLRPYAEGAAKAGQLAKAMPEGYYKGFQQPPRFPQNHVEDFLNAVVERKNHLMDHLGDLWDRAKAHADTGTKLAKMAVATPYLPSPAEMEIDIHQPSDLGSHGSLVHMDKTGAKWLVKTPQAETEFMVPLDVGIGALMSKVGLKSPPIHAVPMRGNLATAVKWVPNAAQVWKEPPHLQMLAAKDLLAIQKHHALDWLIANHDSHVGNWLRDGDGDLIGIDKGQAMKYFGRDRLATSFHPNYYAREPIYNNLWREYSSGMGQMLDPREGKLGAFVQALQDIPDDVYAGIFAPYAHAAAHAGVLGTGSTKGRQIEPERKLGAPMVPENDPDSFLKALVSRKHDLMQDLGTYYDKMTARRQKYLGSHHGDD